MLTKRPTHAMVHEWKRVFEAHRATMQPNAVTGSALEQYLLVRYPATAVVSPSMEAAVTANILENPFYAQKLPAGEVPHVKTYWVGEVRVGIDLVSGFFQVEHEDIETMAAIYDDLFVHRGLDAWDLENPFLVAEYLRLTQHTGAVTP